MIFTALLLVGCAGKTPPAATPISPVEAARNALRNRQPDAAIADADLYLRGDPHGPRAAEALYYKGEGYQNREVADPLEMRRTLFEARSAFLLALNERPDAALEGDIRAGLSNVAFYQDDFPTAIEQATRAMPLVQAQQLKAAMLFQMGWSQQRLARFGDADQTFRQVEQLYPGTPVAAAARQHEGQRNFYVQLATYAAPADAARAVAALQSAGPVVSRRTDAQGHTVIDVGPYSTYANAKQTRDTMRPQFPAAVIVP